MRKTITICKAFHCFVKVAGMVASEEWVYWSDEATFNLNERGGLHPHVQRSTYPWKYTKLYYCYYQQKPGQTHSGSDHKPRTMACGQIRA